MNVETTLCTFESLNRGRRLPSRILIFTNLGLKSSRKQFSLRDVTFIFELSFRNNVVIWKVGLNRLIVGDPEGNVVFDVKDDAYSLAEYTSLSLATGNADSGSSDVQVSLHKESNSPVSDSDIDARD